MAKFFTCQRGHEKACAFGLYPSFSRQGGNFGQPGGGTQFRLMEEIPNDSFQNLQVLPGATLPENEVLKSLSGDNENDLMDDEFFDPIL